MAKHAKRKSKKTAPRRRRRVGALAMTANSPLVTYGSIAIGFLAGDKIDEMLMKVVPATLDTKLVGGAEVGLGAFLVYGKGKKSMVKTVVGGVLMGAGIKKSLRAFGVISGYQMIPSVTGYSDVNALGAAPVRKMAGYIPGKGLNGGYVAKVAVNGGTMDSSMLK